MGIRRFIVREYHKYDRQATIKSATVGTPVHIVREKHPPYFAEIPFLVFIEGGADIGEVPQWLARSIAGDDYTGSILGFVHYAKGTAAIVTFFE
jgi:hypothetical protein